MFALTYVNLEYETSIFILDIWNDDRTLMIDLLLYQLARRLNSQITYENVFHNEIWLINLYMNVGIFNWHNWSYEPTKMKFLNLYQFFTRLLNSKHLKLIRTETWGEIKGCEKRAFELLKIRKNKIKWYIKTKCVTDILLTVRSSSIKGYNLSLGGEHIKDKRLH